MKPSVSQRPLLYVPTSLTVTASFKKVKVISIKKTLSSNNLNFSRLSCCYLATIFQGSVFFPSKKMFPFAFFSIRRFFLSHNCLTLYFVGRLTRATTETPGLGSIPGKTKNDFLVLLLENLFESL